MRHKLFYFFVLLFPIFVQAQTLSMDLPFINENTEPEMFFLDPNYDQNNQISYYSLGDFLRVKYEYDGLHRPVKKTTYLIDKYDLELKKSQATVYNYQGERLISEVTTQFENGKKAILEATETRTPHASLPIDTVRYSAKCLDSRYKNFANTPIANGYTVRYLNKNNLPDSTSYVYTNDDNYTIYLNQYFNYTGTQLTHCKAVNKLITPFDSVPSEWRTNYEYDIAYNTNKINYTYKSSQPIYDVDNWPNILEIKDIVITYSITTDNKGRILSKQLFSNGNLIINNQNSYLPNGKINAMQEIIVDKEFIDYHLSSGSFSLLKSIFDEYNTMKYTVNNIDNCRNTTIYLDGKKRIELNFCSTKDENKSSSRELIKYEERKENKVSELVKNEYQYLNNDTIIRTVYEDDEIDKRIPYKRVKYKKDAADNLLFTQTDDYDETTKTWNPTEKRIYQYNSYGLICQNETYLYSEEPYYSKSYKPNQKSWQGNNFEKWIKDANDRILQYEVKEWDGKQWHNSELFKYAYDASDNRIVDETNSWDKDLNRWRGVSRDSIYTDSANYLTGTIDFRWVDDKQCWLMAQRKEIEKKEYSKSMGADKDSIFCKEEMTTNSRWIDGKWQFETRSIDNRWDVESFYSFSKWDNEKQNWAIHKKEVQQKADNNIITQENYSWSDEDNRLVGLQYITTIPLNEDFSDRRFEYKIWDLQTETWKDTIAVDILEANDSVQNYIYQKYNRPAQKYECFKKVDILKADQQDQFTLNKWNQNSWIGDLRLIRQNSDDSTTKSELQAYDVSTKKWIPRYCNITNSEDEEYLKKWNSTRNDWENFLLMKDYQYYQWNATQQKYVESADYDDALHLEQNIKREFYKVSNATDYEILVQDRSW